MTKIENKPQNKFRMNISISREMYEFIRKTRGNASKLAEQAYYALYSASKNHDVFVMDLQSLVLSSKYENNVKNEVGSLEFESKISSTSMRRHFGPKSENKAQNGMENFSNLGGMNTKYPLLLSDIYPRFTRQDEIDLP